MVAEAARSLEWGLPEALAVMPDLGKPYFAAATAML
jgi:hypothetical protein